MTQAGLGRRRSAIRHQVARGLLCVAACAGGSVPLGANAQVQTPVPADQRGRLDAERAGTHDAANIRTVFWNYGMVGDYPSDPGGVDLSVFHSAEAPKGSGMNYSDGITPFVLAKVRQRSGVDAYIMETGFRERQGTSPYFNRIMRFEPRPGYFQADPAVNAGRSPAISNDPRTWPNSWPDRARDTDDPGWRGSWNGYFGKRAAADQESYSVMDDDYYDAWDFYPDARDSTRRGLGLRIEVRGFQWANPQARNVVFWHYDITNEGTTDYDDNIVFGLYMDSGVGGSTLSCDGIFESDDDNAYFDRTFDTDVLNLVYTWDNRRHGRDLSGDCSTTGYMGYAYLETPGNSFDSADNDLDGIIDEQRDGGPGQQIVGQPEIRDYVTSHYGLTRFEATYGSLETRPAYRAGTWWTGDEDMDWVADLHDLGADGVPDTHDTGEGDGIPTLGEANFDRTDLNESDQIGLTGFKFNRIKAGLGNPDPEADGIVFFNDSQNWPARLYQKFTDPDSTVRFDAALAANYNIAFVFASGPFKLRAGKTERFSLALAYGADLNELRRTVKTVQKIYNANYQFAVPPKLPTVTADASGGRVRLSWNDIAEHSADPVTGELDFEGYRIYRSTDPNFLDPKVISTGNGTGPIGNGKPIAQFDLIDGKFGFTTDTVEGVAYDLGNETGITHTWVDSTVTAGQQYYYAVCAYDFGSNSFGFFPSENAITLSQTLRGGLITPLNAVAVRPEPKIAGYVPATVATAAHVAGDGIGTVGVSVVNSSLVLDGHLMKLAFLGSPDSVHAAAYTLTDSTTSKLLFRTGADFDAQGVGAVGGGLLPLVRTAKTVEIDAAGTGFARGSGTNIRLLVEYLPVAPINARRPGFPEDVTITFDDVVRDTSLANFPLRANPTKFIAFAHTPSGDLQLDLRYSTPLVSTGTLSTLTEYFDLVTYLPSEPGVVKATWRLKIDPTSVASGQAIIAPRRGDVFELRLRQPFGTDDVFVFEAHGEKVDAELAAAQFAAKPYVVPNPYVGSASFEPARFAVSGRGERRMEFRNIPLNASLRIFTVRGELVQTLRQDGSTSGAIPWNLRTKDNLDVAPGLYIFQVDGFALGASIGKFAILK